MERYRVRANFNGNLSSNTNSFQPKLSSNTNSFQPKHSSRISLPPKPPLNPPYRIEDTELSIFDAERYFNEGNKQPNTLKKPPPILVNQVTTENCDPSKSRRESRDSSVSSIDGYGRNWRTRSFRSAPTSSSEASWNSQTGLLSNPPGSAPLNVKAYPLNEKRKPGSPSLSSSRRFFSRNCPCYGKKSVDVEEKYSDPKSPVRFSTDTHTTKIESPVSEQVVDVTKIKISTGLNWSKHYPGFTFPVPAPKSGTDDPARNSLEVFRPPDELLPSLRKCPQEAASDDDDDDAASDTSSDLFEIESFSTNPVYRRRDSLDEFPKLAGNAAGILQFKRSLEEIAPSECYAPSEVSVEWSVTTAEPAFDRASMGHFSSAASDYEEVQFVQMEHDKVRSKKKGGLLSCRCESSVNVAPNPVRIERPKQKEGDREMGLGVSRFGLEKIELGQPN